MSDIAEAAEHQELRSMYEGRTNVITGTDLAPYSTESLIMLRDDASQAYYAGEPFMDDADFDTLLEVLRDRDVEETVGHGYAPTGQKVRHAKPMLSLDKVRTAESIEEFLAKIAVPEVIVQPKYDGLAVSITYGTDGKIEVGATRGSGVVGEDVTHTVRAMAAAGALPATVETNGERVVVRGEVIVFRSELQRLNSSSRATRTYANPRNAAAGLLRRQDTDLADFLQLIAYDADVPGQDGDRWLQEHGFHTSESFHLERKVSGSSAKSLAAQVWKYIEEFGREMESVDFDTDGVVIKAVGTGVRKRLGDSRTAPRWAVAYKYPNTYSTTILRNVEWSTGRTGRIVPVAIFDPTTLSGAEVTNATLHNLDQLREHDLRLGDTIKVTRSNEVIPYVLGREGDHAAGSVEIEVPTECPNCGGAVHVSAADLVCDLGPDCNAVAKIVHSLQTLDVLGVGPSLVGSLYRAGEIEDFLDLLNVPASAIEALDGYGEVSAANAVAAIETAFEQPLWRWIAAIGLPRIGYTSSQILEDHFDTLEALSEATYEEVLALDHFGPTKAQTIADSSDTIAIWAARLKQEHFYTPVPTPPMETTESEFTGLNVCVTGTLPSMSRNEAHAWLAEHGANVQGSVSSKTDLLIAGEKAGSKRSKAESLGIRIMDGDTFESKVGA